MYTTKITTPVIAGITAIAVLIGCLPMQGIAAAAGTDCEVTDKLVNTCRPWLGAAVNDHTGVGKDYASQVKDHERIIGRQVDFVHTYYGPNKNKVNKKVISRSDRAMYGRSGTYLFVNYKPVAQWRDAHEGNQEANRYVDRMAQSIKSLGNKKIMMTLNHEAENDITGGVEGCSNFKRAKGAAGGTPAEFRAMWAYTQERFAAQGVTNVVWAMDYMNYDKWRCVVDDLWPGNDRVDWVVFNAYAYGKQTAQGNITQFENVLRSYQSSSRDFASKPWGIAEWNTHNMPRANAYRYYDDMKRIANGELSLPKALNAYFVFDATGPDGNNNRIAEVWTGKGTGHNAVYRKDSTKLKRYIDFANSPAFKN